MIICYYAKEEFKTNMVTYGCDYYLIGRKVHYLPPMKKMLVEYASVFFCAFGKGERILLCV